MNYHTIFQHQEHPIHAYVIYQWTDMNYHHTEHQFYIYISNTAQKHIEKFDFQFLPKF